MKNKLLALIATMTACLSMFAGTNMCIKKQNGDILKFNVDDIYEVYYEAFINGGDTTIVPPFIDSVVVDASSLPLEFKIMSESEAQVTGYDYRYFYDEAGNYVEKEIEIPAKVKIDGKIYDVTSIRNNAFGWCSNLTSITIPENVTAIGDSVFQGCSSLESITIPESVTSIGDGTFRYCERLTSINVSIDNQNYSSLDGILYNKEKTVIICVPQGIVDDVVIPSSVTSIGRSAFSSCEKLTSITIPESVTSIGDLAFAYCDTLDITIDNNYYSVQIGYNSFKDVHSVTYKDAIETSGIKFSILTDSTLIVDTIKTDVSEVIIPSEIYNNGKRYDVTRIENVAALAKDLKRVEIPSSVIFIGRGAFYECRNLDVIIDNSRNNVEVGSDAFYNVKSVTWKKDDPSLVDESETTLEFKVLSDSTAEVIKGYSYIDSIIIPEKVRIEGKNYQVVGISENAFFERGIKSVTIPEGIKYIGRNAFKSCEITSIAIPSSCTNISDGAFSRCNQLTSVYVDLANPAYSSIDGVLYNKEKSKLIYYPRGRQHEHFIVPSSVIIIGDSAFMYSQIESVEIPSSVSNIGSYAFSECDSLTSVSIAKGNISIGERAFEYCENLDIVIYNSIENIKFYRREYDYATGDYNNQETTMEDSYAFYNVKSVTWKKDDSLIVDASDSPLKFKVLSDSTAEIVYGNYYNLDSVNIPEKVRIDGKDYDVTTIGDGAFYGCRKFTSVKIPKSVTTIGSGAFSSCYNLISIDIPESVTSIRDSVFAGCSSLKSIVIPEGVTVIEYYTFFNCDSLTTVSLPNSILTIETNAFRECRHLTNVTIPDGVTSIGAGAFESCSSLTSINIPESVTSIEGGAFSGCSGLESVTIPESVTSIGWSAFSGCKNLDIVIENSEENVEVGSNAFYEVKSVTYTK